MSAWSTYWRDGGYRLAPADVTPGLTAARELARHLSWIVNKSSLLDQAAWIKDPYRLHQDLAVLDADVDLLHRVKLKDTNERLKRLGFKELTPLRLPRREVEVPGETITGGQTIRRYFENANPTIR